MTAQRHDHILWERSNYEIIAAELSDHELLFDPKVHGIEPVMLHTGCYRGFYAEYLISDDVLFLDKLTIRKDKGRYPKINGVAPVVDREERNAQYLGLMLPILVTGTLRIGKDFIKKRHVNMGFQEATAYKTVIDVQLESGRLIKCSDRSDEVFRIFEVQKIVVRYLRYHWLTHEWLCMLMDNYGLVDEGDIARTFNPMLEPLDADKVHGILEDIKARSVDLRWMLINYADYYERAHDYEFMFGFLAFLGCPSKILRFLKGLVSPTCTEEQVVLAFLETLRTTHAYDIWGETISVITEKQYLKAEVPLEVKSAVEKRFAGEKLSI